MVVTRDIEPWDELLQAGRDDERLVTQSSVHPRPGKRGRDPRGAAPEGRRGAARAAASSACGRTRPRRSTPRWAGPTIVTTGTASGKSLCFQLPTLDVLCRDARARALYLYPTKALAQDQARALQRVRRQERARPAIYDGDTPREQRSAIRRNANVVLTNPDMLHLGILPNHPAWGELLLQPRDRRRRRGARLPRRVRLARRQRPAAPATGRRRLRHRAALPDGERHDRQPGRARRAAHRASTTSRSSTTTARPVTKRTIAMWNPPITDEKLGTRRSVLSEAADLLAELVTQGARTIVFMKSRKAVELMAKFTQLALEDLGHPELAERIAPYRAGYTPAAAARARAQARRGRAARRRLHRRARARHRHRLARRRDLRDVPRHGRLAAAAVGPRRPPRPRARGLRRGRGRARPVLLPPPRRVPRPPGRERDPRPRERADPRRSTCSARRTRARSSPPTPSTSGLSWKTTAERLVATGALRERPGGTYVPRRPEDFPAAEVVAALGQPRRLRDRRHRLRRADRHRRPRARDARPPTRARSTSTAAASSRSPSSTSTRAARSSSRSRATGTRSPRSETDTYIERAARPPRVRWA